MAFQQGLSGLYAASKALDVTSNNVANSATVGFKSSSTHFADVYANSLSGAGSGIGIGTSVGAVQQQFTQGNITTTNNPLDISINGGGFYRMSNNGVVTYTRNGQFHLDKDGFIVDDQMRNLTGYPVVGGMIVQSAPVPLQLSSENQDPVATGQNTSGSYQGVLAQLNLDSRNTVPSDATTSANAAAAAAARSVAAAAATAAAVPGATVADVTAAMTAARADAIANAAAAAGGTTNATTSATNAANAAIAAAGAAANAAAAATAAAGVATTNNTAFNNTFDYQNPLTYTFSTALPIFDSLGNAHTMTLYAVKTANPGEWVIHSSVDGTSPANSPLANSTLQFDTSGQLTGGTGLLNTTIDLDAVMLAQGSPNNAAPTLTFELDFAGTTQFGSASGTNRLQQDGYTSGRLTGISVSADGVIRGNYSNGQSRDLGQVVLTNFTNPNGLTSLGSNQWAETSASGPALIGAPNTGSLGVLQSLAVEESNVDLTAELVNMITEQRNYQANAQSIKTQDQIMQTLVNLR